MDTTSPKTVDNRMWAILLIGVILLLISSIRSHHIPDAVRSTEQHMVLSVSDGALLWQPKTNPIQSGLDNNLKAELTPFFFKAVPINRADKLLLTTLPGVGPGMAERIIAFRKAHGSIPNAEVFLHIPGIGSKRYNMLQPLISFQ